MWAVIVRDRSSSFKRLYLSSKMSSRYRLYSVRQLGVTSRGVHQLESAGVVVSDRAGDVVENLIGIFQSDPSAHPALERSSCGPAYSVHPCSPPSGRHLPRPRQIADRVPDSHPSVASAGH